jgi:hypothetical protein
MGKTWENHGKLWEMSNLESHGKIQGHDGNIWGKLMDNVKEIVGKLRETSGTGKPPWENLKEIRELWRMI